MTAHHTPPLRRWLAVFPPLALALLMLGGGSTPKGLDQPITNMGTALKEVQIAVLHTSQVYASNAFILLGIGALGVSFVAIAMLAGGFDSAIAVVAASLGGFGCLCGVVVNVLVGLDLAGAASAATTREEAARILVSTNTASVSTAFLVGYLACIAVGAILMGIALWRSRRVSRWLSVAFPVTFLIGAAAPAGVINVVLSVPIAVVMVLLAVRIWRAAPPDTVSAAPVRMNEAAIERT